MRTGISHVSQAITILAVRDVLSEDHLHIYSECIQKAVINALVTDRRQTGSTCSVRLYSSCQALTYLDLERCPIRLASIVRNPFHRANSAWNWPEIDHVGSQQSQPWVVSVGDQPERRTSPSHLPCAFNVWLATGELRHARSW